MKTVVNSKRIVAVLSALVMILMIFSNASAETYTYRTLTYLAGDVDNLVGASEVSFQKIINTTFDAAASSRFSRNGYHLKSWYVPSTGETVGTGSQYTMPDHDITFVANWVPETYKITFTGKGGKTDEGSANIYIDAEYGTTMILPENPFTYSGYQFKGWQYDGVTYNAGDEFEIPAILSGAKIVISAVWSKSSNIVTTAPVTTVTTQTTTVITSAETEATASAPIITSTATDVSVTESLPVSSETATVTDVNSTGSTLIKKYELNAELDFNDSDKKMYYIQMDEIAEEGTIEKLEINLSSKNGNINNFIAGIGTVVDGSWYQIDYNENIQSQNYTINFADPDICGKINGGSIQVGYWWGNTAPLYIDSLTVTYKTESAVTTAPPVTTMSEAASDENIVSTAETTTSCIETTTVSENLITVTTSLMTSEPVTTVTTAEQTTTVTTLKNSQYSKIVSFNTEIENNSTITINAGDLLSVNQIVESIQLNFTSDGRKINNYTISVGISRNDNGWEQIDFQDNCDCSQLIIGVEISEEIQKMITEDGCFNISYWWGDNENLVLESVRVNYRIDSGDYNKDGKVTLEDAEALRKYMVGIKTSGFEIDNQSADLNGDGKVNVFDYMYLARLLA